MFYAYILRSKTHPDETYIGSTSDLRKLLAEHNSGKSIHTNKVKPQELMAYIALPEKYLAEKFEDYLKSGSGRSFAKRHLLMQDGGNLKANSGPNLTFQGRQIEEPPSRVMGDPGLPIETCANDPVDQTSSR
jgi:putative endonuclease